MPECSSAVMLEDGSINGSLFFLHVNVSGGEPRETQDNVIVDPISAVMLGGDGSSITGAAMQGDKEQ